MIQNLTLLDINMPQLLLIYDRRMYIDIEIFCSCDCFHLVTHFQKLKFFIFRNRFVVLSILSANSICKMSLSKAQNFLFFESGNYGFKIP